MTHVDELARLLDRPPSDPPAAADGRLTGSIMERVRQVPSHGEANQRHMDCRSTFHAPRGWWLLLPLVLGATLLLDGVLDWTGWSDAPVVSAAADGAPAMSPLLPLGAECAILFIIIAVVAAATGRPRRNP